MRNINVPFKVVKARDVVGRVETVGHVETEIVDRDALHMRLLLHEDSDVFLDASKDLVLVRPIVFYGFLAKLGERGILWVQSVVGDLGNEVSQSNVAMEQQVVPAL